MSKFLQPDAICLKLMAESIAEQMKEPEYSSDWYKLDYWKKSFEPPEGVAWSTDLLDRLWMAAAELTCEFPGAGARRLDLALDMTPSKKKGIGGLASALNVGKSGVTGQWNKGSESWKTCARELSVDWQWLQGDSVKVKAPVWLGSFNAVSGRTSSFLQWASGTKRENHVEAGQEMLAYGIERGGTFKPYWGAAWAYHALPALGEVRNREVLIALPYSRLIECANALTEAGAPDLAEVIIRARFGFDPRINLVEHKQAVKRAPRARQRNGRHKLQG